MDKLNSFLLTLLLIINLLSWVTITVDSLFLPLWFAFQGLYQEYSIVSNVASIEHDPSNNLDFL